MRPRIIFFGTPLFGQIILQKLLDENFNIAAVVTQPDRPVGRDQKLTPSPVKTLANERKIPVLAPADKQSLLAASRKLSALKPTLLVVASYGMIVPQEILDPPENTPTAMVKLAQFGGKLLARTIPNYLSGKITPQPQDHTQATYTKLIKKEDGKLTQQE